MRVIRLSQTMQGLLRPEFEKIGLQLDSFAVESISLPENLQKTLEQRISMGIVGDMSKYTQYQTASSIPLAAQNEGGLAGIGAGLAAGMGMGQLMTNAMTGAMQNTQANSQPAPAPAPAAASVVDPGAKLTQLKALLDQQLISQEDYDKAKAEVLKQLIG